MSDTPRTDAFIAAQPPIVFGDPHSLRAHLIASAEYARQLERENAALREALQSFIDIEDEAGGLYATAPGASELVVAIDRAREAIARATKET